MSGFGRWLGAATKEAAAGEEGDIDGDRFVDEGCNGGLILVQWRFVLERVCRAFLRVEWKQGGLRGRCEKGQRKRRGRREKRKREAAAAKEAVFTCEPITKEDLPNAHQADDDPTTV